MSGGGILSNHRFLVLWTGNGLSLLGISGVRLTYPLVVLATSGSPAWAGWVTLCATLPGLLFQVPAGALADAFNRRQVMIISQVAGLLATVAALWAVTVDSRWSLTVLMVSAFIEGTAYAVFSIAEVAAIRDVTAEHERAAAYSFYEAEQPVANLVGRAVAGALYGVGRWLPFAANGVSYLICAVTLLTCPRRMFDPRAEPSKPLAGEADSFWSTTLDGLRWTWNVPFLRFSTFVTGFANIVFQVLILFFVVVGTERGYQPWLIGLILASSGVGGVAASFATAWLDRRLGQRGTFAAALWVWAFTLLVIALTTNPIVLALAWAVAGAGGVVVALVLTMSRLRAVPEAALGKVVGAASTITDGAVPLGAILAGYLLSVWETSEIGWALFICMLLLAVAGSRNLARNRRLDAQHTAPYGSESVGGKNEL
ncbi:MFS transporter [Actinoplanes subglobosus]|uniref:MFS transporter n=1 Tax=Actinoplanes subglobosus TaxID=1547892 RepID=A0ABV8IKX9_9ACTN